MIFATYNIAHCADFSKHLYGEMFNISLDKIANVIKKINADVIGLNEVYDKGEREELCNQTEKLSTLAGYSNYVFATSEEVSNNITIGNAQLTNYKIKGVKTYPVLAPKICDRNPNENRLYEDRVIIKTIIETKQGDVSVINTHFGLNPLEQKNIVKKLISIISKETLPCVLMGDFNVEPNSEILKPIYEIMASASQFLNNEEYTFSSQNPYCKIDYLFFSKHFVIKEYIIDKNIVSDHFAIYALANLK